MFAFPGRSLWASRTSPKRGSARPPPPLVAVVLGLCLSSIALAERTWSVAAILVVMGAAAGMLNVHIGAWAMQRIDVAVRGRVSSVLMLAAFGVAPMSLGVAGFLVAWNLKLMFLFAGGLM